MKILVVDDERLARERLARMVVAAGHEVMGEAADGQGLWQLLKREMPDVVLLDIDMPGEDGVSIGKRLASLDCPPAVIFVTAYPQHALQAFGAHAVDYLLKPVSADRLRAALDAAAKMNRAQAATTGQTAMRLTARVGREVRVLPLESVIFFESRDKYVTAHTADGEFLLEQSLRQLEEEVGSGFLRVHRAALVAKGAIERLENDAKGRHWLYLRGLTQPVEVSRRQLRLVKEWLHGGMGAP